VPVVDFTRWSRDHSYLVEYVAGGLHVGLGAEVRQVAAEYDHGGVIGAVAGRAASALGQPSSDPLDEDYQRFDALVQEPFLQVRADQAWSGRSTPSRRLASARAPPGTSANSSGASANCVYGPLSAQPSLHPAVSGADRAETDGEWAGRRGKRHDDATAVLVRFA
jgi:hypothetical protein